MKNLEKGTKVIDKFSKSKTFGRVAIILEQDSEGDYWCFFPNTAYGSSVTDEEDEYLESIGIDEFGTCGYCFPDMIELA